MHNNIRLLTEEQKETFRIIESYPFKINLLNYFHGDKQGWSHGNLYVKNQPNTLYFIEEGDGFILHNQKKTLLKSDQIYLIPSNLSRGFGCKTMIKKYYVMFEMNNALGRDLFHGLSDVICLGSWRKEFLPIFKKGLNNNTAYIQLRYAILNMLAKRRILEKGIMTINHKEDRYKDIFKFIEENLNATISISDLSDIMKMSTQGLSRAFHRDMNQTLKSFLNDKINRGASDYLIHSELLVKEIGEKMGFDDEYYFNRFFKKMNGKTPLAYRKEFRHKSN